ncbi:hypothetical protein [Caldimonas sp. KR1-144]|uniref:hypothetical protein n=1 Tax=Caldimonas sp. KR1-144 TaxID=3400911 RepID=UPI003C02DE91
MQDALDAPTKMDAAPPPSPPKTIGDLIDKLTEVKRERAALSKQDKVLKAQEDELDEALMDLLDASGTRGAAGQTASVSIQESVVPTLKNFELFAEFLYENRYLHLLNRALNAAACREVFEKFGSIPGVEPFNKRSLRYTAR